MDQIPTVEINNLRDYNNRLICLPKYWVVLMTEDNKEQSTRSVPMIAPAPADNPLTKAKIELGRQLFFDTRLYKIENE